MFWSDGMQRLMMKIHEASEGLTRHEQDIYDSTIGFYLISKKLKDWGVIESGGRDDRNRKLWVLTERAKQDDVIEAIKTLRKYFGDWDDGKVEETDNGVKCKNCGHEMGENEPLCECPECDVVLKW